MSYQYIEDIYDFMAFHSIGKNLQKGCWSVLAIAASGNYTNVEILVGNSCEKIQSTIGSSGRSRITHANAMPMDRYDHYELQSNHHACSR